MFDGNWRATECKGAMTLRETVADEFSWRKFRFKDCPASSFRHLKWTSKLWAVATYRVCICVYCLAWLITDLTFNRDPIYYVYLTNWGEVVMCLYFTFALLCVVLPSVDDLFRPLSVDSPFTSSPLDVRSVSISTPLPAVPTTFPSAMNNPEPDLKWYHQVCWALFYLYADTAPFISIFYWYGVQHGIVNEWPSILPVNIHVHAMNLALLTIELAVNDLPFRLMHFYVSATFGLVFIIFTLGLHLGGVTSAVYPVLDWTHPETAVAIAVAALLICSVCTHTIFFAVRVLKDRILRAGCCSRSCCSSSYCCWQRNINVTSSSSSSSNEPPSLGGSPRNDQQLTSV